MRTLEKAFMIRGEEHSAYLTKQLSSGKRVCVADLKVASARDFLSLTHALETIVAVNNQSQEFGIKILWHFDELTSIEGVTHRKKVVHTDYFKQADDYSLELVEHQH